MKLTPEQIEKLETFLTRVEAVGVRTATAEADVSVPEVYAAISCLRKLLNLRDFANMRRPPPRPLKANEIREYLAMKAAQQAGPAS